MANSESFEAVYACAQHAGYAFRVGKKRYRFEKHQLIITDEAEAGAFDKCLKDVPTIGAKVKKVDAAAAEALVKNHIATHGGAKSGMFSSKANGQHEAEKMTEGDAQLNNVSQEDKDTITDAFKEDGLVLTEKTDVVTPVEEVSKLQETTKPAFAFKQAAKAS